MEDTESDKEQPLTSESSTNCCAEFPLPSSDEASTVADVTVEQEKEVVDNPHSDYPPCHAASCVTRKETADVPPEESRDFKHVGGDSDEGEDREVCNETEDICQEVVLEIKESEENVWEETTEEGDEVIAEKEHEEKMQDGGKEQDSAICEIWDELEDVVCEVIEDKESKQVEKEGARGSVALDGDTMEDVKVGEEEEQIAKVSGEMEKETNLPTCDEAIQGKHAVNDEAQLHDREEVVAKEKENNDKERADEQRRTPPSVDKQPKEVRSDVKELKEGRKCEESDGSQGGVGRKLVVSKHPKVYQVKAVPVVPPKPQHCKITALTLRQQQQQRERRNADSGRENTPKEQARDGDDGDEGRGKREKPTLRGGEKERERRRDGDESATRDTNRNSPLSMCFDEAVAIATMRREKEKECEKEKERQRDWGNEVQ